MIGRKPSSALETVRRKQIHIEMILTAVVVIISLFLPYVSYTYKSKSYIISGFSLLTGKTVCGGKVVLSPNIPMIILVLCAVACLLAAFFDYLRNQNTAYGIATVASLVMVIDQIFFLNLLSGQLRIAKDVTVAYGSTIGLVLALAMLIWGMYRLWKNKILCTLDFMALPGLLYFIINNYIPMLGIVIAFKKIDYSVGIMASPWVGFENFRQLFASNAGFFESVAWRITRNTLLYNSAFIIVGNVTGIIVGICLADIFSRKMQKFFQTSILLPQLISYVIVAYIVFGFFSNEAGFINHVFGTNINFYAEQKYWPFVLVFIYTWKMIGYNAIIYLSSIVGIDRNIYEASMLDGCSRWQQVRHVTLPMLKPTTITLVMLSVGRIMYSDFGLFYQVTRDSGALYNVADTIDTYVYRSLMTLNNISTSSAACAYQALIGFVLVMLVNWIVRRKDKENALF